MWDIPELSWNLLNQTELNYYNIRTILSFRFRNLGDKLQPESIFFTASFFGYQFSLVEILFTEFKQIQLFLIK